MKKILFGILFSFCISSCSIGIHKTYIKDYTEQMEYLKTDFPEVYNLYINGNVIIKQMYIYKDTISNKEKIRIKYRYRDAIERPRLHLFDKKSITKTL